MNLLTTAQIVVLGTVLAVNMFDDAKRSDRITALEAQIAALAAPNAEGR